MVKRLEKNKHRYHEDPAPVVRRTGGHTHKARPASDGHILSQQGSWPEKVESY